MVTPSSWQIDLFGQIQRSIQAAKADTFFAEFDAQDIRQTLFSDVATNYLRIRLIQEQIRLLRQSIGVQEQTQKLVVERQEAGVSTELDSAQTDSFVLRSRTLLASLEQQLNLEFNSLSILLGQVPSQELKQYFIDGGTVGLPVIPEIGFPTNLLRNRPDVRREEMAFISCLAAIGVAEADLYPQLTLLGTISVSAQSISTLFQTDSLAFNLGPSLRWNIFQSGRIKANIAATEARCEQAQLEYQQTVISAAREVEDSIVNYNGFMNQANTISMAVDADKRAVELSLERYKAGRANFQRVLDAQQQQLQDLQLRASVRVQALQELVRLYNGLGGRWDYHPSPTEGQGCLVTTPVTGYGNAATVENIGTGNSECSTANCDTSATIDNSTSLYNSYPDAIYSNTPNTAYPNTTYPLDAQSVLPADQNVAPRNVPAGSGSKSSIPATSPPIDQGVIFDATSAKGIDIDNLSSLNDW